MNDTQLTPTGAFLQKSLSTIASYDEYETHMDDKDVIHVPHAGTTFITAYEQLRSVAENIEDNMVMQAAILRFYTRNLIITKAQHKLGKELVIELTQAGYLENNSVPSKKYKDIDALVATYTDLRSQLSRSPVPSSTYDRWILELLTVQSEQILQSSIRTLSFAHFAHHFLTQHIDYVRIVGDTPNIQRSEYPKLLYIAIHRELIKSNDANARAGLFDLYKISPNNIEVFVQFNQDFDNYAEHTATEKLTRFVAKNGAPLQIIKKSYFEKIENRTANPTLESPSKTEGFISSHIDHIYDTTKHTVNQGIIKSIMFLLIARVVIGLLIELPYDLITTGRISLVPLLVNIIVPILFLIITVVTYKKPKEQNKLAIQQYVRAMLYREGHSTSIAFKYPDNSKKNYSFEIVFGLTFILALYLIVGRLTSLDYNWVEGLIFILFFSTANFLGYRLTLLYRDIEHISTDQGSVAIIRNFMYLPFVFIGKHIARRSEKFNLVAQFMDIIIDLPLKTVVRLIRQWLDFIQGKKDAIS